MHTPTQEEPFIYTYTLCEEEDQTQKLKNSVENYIEFVFLNRGIPFNELLNDLIIENENFRNDYFRLLEEVVYTEASNLYGQEVLQQSFSQECKKIVDTWISTNSKRANVRVELAEQYDNQLVFWVWLEAISDEGLDTDFEKYIVLSPGSTFQVAYKNFLSSLPEKIENLDTKPHGVFEIIVEKHQVGSWWLNNQTHDYSCLKQVLLSE